MANQLLAGKVAVVMGAASNLGQTIARKFVEQGARVILADNNWVQARNKLLKTLNNNDGTIYMVHGVHCDVRDPAKVSAAVNEANSRYNRIDIFYNNAGVENQHLPALAPSSIIDINSFKDAMALNVESVIASINYASEVMATNPAGAGGCILCTGSTVGSLGDVMPSCYSISKAALVDVVRAAANKLGSKGVRVNVISPHNVVANFERKMLQQIFPKADETDLDNMIARYQQNNKVSDDDVANAAVYLASEDGKRINGQNFVLNGKFTL